jgi:GNAT superfamily N-acetyltransferase
MAKENVKHYLTSTHFEVEYEWGYTSLRIDRGTSLANISIYVEEGERKQGLSRVLVRSLCEHVEKTGVAPTNVYIDTDSSDGFWAYLGFAPNPNMDNEDVPEFGYELVCAWETLCRFGNNTKSEGSAK